MNLSMIATSSGAPMIQSGKNIFERMEVSGSEGAGTTASRRPAAKGFGASLLLREETPYLHSERKPLMSTDDTAPEQLPASAASREQIERWSVEMNTPIEAVESAVKAVGPDLDRIKDYLTGGAAATQQDG